MNERIVEQVARFPDGPGVYIFSDARGKALYVGKAAKLRTRVRSYLRPGGDGRPQLRFLEREADSVEFVAVATEQEALLLENTVIKKRKPRYNFKLKDDKAFLMLRLDRSEDWPWFRLVRRRRSDRAEYYGPYASATAVRRTLKLLHKIVPLRDCKDGVFHNRSRPCLKHEIGRCPAPCVGLIERAAYDELLDEATAILSGGVGPVLRRLRDDMDAAAAALEFERAHELRLQCEALQAVAERQTVDSGGADHDVVGLARREDGVTVVVMMFRGGKLESRRRFEVTSVLPDELLLGDVLTRFYEGDRYVPREVLLPLEIDGQDVLGDWLSDKRGAQVEVRVPQRGAGKKHLALAAENARLEDATRDTEARRGAEVELAHLLGLEEPPARMHCIDVSTTQGRETVASRVAFVGGVPDKDAYRRFAISAEHAGDDFSAMREAVFRSLRLCIEEAADDELPDLLIVDGGQGQLASAVAAIEELGVTADVPVTGLAKSRLQGVGDARRATQERLFVPGSSEPIPLADAAPATLLVAALRDEAHRFAITYHRKKRGALTSELDGIPGVGPARRRLLLRHFGSLAALRDASVEELRGVEGMPAAVAEAVYSQLRGDDAPE